MNALTFDSLRIALDDAGARVRIEDEVPLAVPFIKGIRMSGGFMDGQCIHFSPNLNCIIGGRGTGKSVTFEAIRCLAGQPSKTTVIDSDVWPDQIDLLVEDQAGQIHHLTRARAGDVENADDPLEGAVAFLLSATARGRDTADRASRPKPTLLLFWITSIGLSIWSKKRGVRRSCARPCSRSVQSKIEEAIRKVELIPQYERDLALAQSQIQALEKAKAKDIIVLQRKVELERQARQVISTSVQAIARGTGQQDLKDNSPLENGR